MHGRENIPLQGHREGSCFSLLEEDEQHRGTFNALFRFRVDTGDSILKEHLEKGSKNALCVSLRIQNELIAICGDLIYEKIITDIKKSPHFSVVCHETTDIAGTEQLMSICVRFLGKKKLLKHLLPLLH